MIIDYLSINLININLCSVLLFVFNLNKKNIFYLLILDLIINGIPFITLIIVLFYYLNKVIFKYLNNNFINNFLLLIAYYFLFNIVLFSIFNYYNPYVFKIIINNLIYNIILYYIGLKYLTDKYN
jgi:hypothetical protein